MVHLAMFDAVNAIDRRFTPYAVEALADTSASPEAAAVTAAHAMTKKFVTAIPVSNVTF